MSFGKASSSENSQTNQSQNGTQSQTQTPNNLGALQQGWAAAENNLNGGNSGANSALDLITGNATGASNAANTGLDAVLKLIQGGATNGANQYLTPTASGANIGNNNPGFQNVVDQIARSAQQSTDGNFAAAGRYGSGANANAFNTAVANEAGQLGYTNYNQSVQNQLNAGAQLSANNSNSANAVLQAMGIIPNLSATSTGAGETAYNAATAPTNTFANILALLGSGGGTANGTSSGTASGTSSGSSSGLSFGADLGKLFNVTPFKLFG